MRYLNSLLVLIMMFTFISCEKEKEEAPETSEQLPAGMHSVKVIEAMDASDYTYINVDENGKKYWPDFLQLAVGYSGRNNVTQREFILSLDYDLELIPIESDFADMLKSILNMIHLPAPGVKFSPSNKPEFHLLLLN